MRLWPIPQVNCQLLDAHRPPAGWAELPDSEPYLWDHLAEHLVEAGRGEELVATVKDWRYLAKKIFLRKSHPVENDLIQAVKYAPDGDPQRALRRTFANTGCGDVAAEIIRDTERKWEPIRRADIDGDYEPAAQGRDVLEYLTAACQAALGQPSACCLLPNSS